MFINLFLLLIVAYLVLLERKILGLAQIRKGPNIVRLFGILQTIIDGVKLVYKSFVLIKKNEYYLFIYSPLFNFFLALLNYFFFCIYFIKININYSILFNFFIRRVIVYTVLRSRWRSNNSYSLIRSLRAVAQIISYEVVLSFFILIMILKFNSLSWYRLIYNNIFNNNHLLLFLVLRIIIFSAELNRTPFDLVEGESELIRRYNVEYSRVRFTFLFLAEYVNIWFYSFVLVIIFFKINFIYFYSFIFSIVFCWVRAMLPRYKFLDLIILIWKTLLPLITFIYIILLYILHISLKKNIIFLKLNF